MNVYFSLKCDLAAVKNTPDVYLKLDSNVKEIYLFSICRSRSIPNTANLVNFHFSSVSSTCQVYFYFAIHQNV